MRKQAYTDCILNNSSLRMITASHKMKTFKIEFTVIILIYMTTITTSEVLEIFRRSPEEKDGWEKGADSFTIPHSLCGQHGRNSKNCVSFNAKDTNRGTNLQCHCSCSNENATLMFTNNEWKCIQNSKVRDLLGFDDQYTFFNNEIKDTQLRMLNSGDLRRVSLSNRWRKCAVDTGSSWFIGCEGVHNSFSSRIFSIKSSKRKYYLKVTSDVSNIDILKGRIIKLTIQCTKPYVRKKLLFKFEGTLNCSISVPTSQPSITTTTTSRRTTLPLKTESETTHTSALVSVPNPTGFTTLSTVSDNSPSVSDSSPSVSDSPTTVSNAPTIVIVTPSVTLLDSPSTAAITRPTVSLIKPTASVAPPSTPTVSVTPSTVSVSQPTISKIPPDSFVPSPTTRARDPSTTTDVSTNVPTQPNSGRERSSGADSTPSLGLISGIAVSVLLIIIVVAFLLYRRRCSSKKPCLRTKNEENKNSAMMTLQTNSFYEPDGQHVYKTLNFREPPIYASHYKVPHHPSTEGQLNNKEKQSDQADTNEDHFYAPLNIPEGHNIYGLGNNQDTHNDRMYQNYGPICVEQPVYNLLEELHTVQGSEGPINDGAEPVYNVVDEPYLDASESFDQYGTICSEEAVYSTLERPCYDDVSKGSGEKPKYINEPIYNVLEEESTPSVSTEDLRWRLIHQPGFVGHSKGLN